MPPKTAVQPKQTPANRKNEPRTNRGQKGSPKADEAPAAAGPTVRANIKAAPPPMPQGASFLAALNSTRAAAQPEPVAAEPPRVEEPKAPTPQKVPTPAPEEAPAPVEVAPPAVNSQFSWAEDEYTSAEKPVEEEPEEPVPQFAAQYPDSVLQNRADVTFKAPEHLMKSAAEQLRVDQRQLEEELRKFQRRVEAREAELNQKEAELNEKELLIRRETEKITSERQQLMQQQAQLVQQQQQQQQQAQQQAQQQPSPMNPGMSHIPMQRYPGMVNYQENWDQSQYDVYSGFPRNGMPFRPNRGGGIPRGGYFPNMAPQYPSQSRPVNGFAAAQPRPAGSRNWNGQ